MSEKQNDKWAEELKGLPIFNMSLSSKELFHSNFIGWILETYPVEMGKKFSEVLDLEKNEKIVNVQREKNNIDLSFELGDTLVLIENKVKSIAYKEQLNKYSKHKIPKDKKAKYILLSLKEPTFIGKDETPYYKEWLYVSYEEFINEYLELLLDSKMDQYYESLIRDYIKFIDILDKNIMQEIDNTSIVNFYKKDTDENKLFSTLKEIRMHDFFQKGLFENLAQSIYSRLGNDNDSVEVHLGKREKGKDYNKTVTINHGMTRAVGLLDIKYQYDKNITIGIQIQGNQYRKIIEGTDEKNVFSKAEELKDSLFNFPGVLNDNDILPSNDNTKLKELVDTKKINVVDLAFNKYHTGNHLFLYKYATLDKILGNEDTTEKKQINQKLVDLVCKDIENMIQPIK